MMKRHIRERVQMLSKQRNEKLKLLVAKRNLPKLTDDEVAAIELQLTTLMNLESRKEVNCTLLGKQNEKDRKELKRKLWTDPKELIATRNENSQYSPDEKVPDLRREVAPGDRQQPKLRGERRVSTIRDPQPPGEKTVDRDDTVRHVDNDPDLDKRYERMLFREIMEVVQNINYLLFK